MTVLRMTGLARGAAAEQVEAWIDGLERVAVGAEPLPATTFTIISSGRTDRPNFTGLPVSTPLAGEVDHSGVFEAFRTVCNGYPQSNDHS